MDHVKWIVCQRVEVLLPSLSAGGARRWFCNQFFRVIRQQFGMSIGQFEGIESHGRVVGKTLIWVLLVIIRVGPLIKVENRR